MKTSLFVWIILFLLLIGVGCKKEQLVTDINRTIHVRNNGADMPVHLHGNFETKVIVLVVHGGPGGDDLGYRLANGIRTLESRYLMAYWDQRGQGMSHGKYEKENLTVQMMAEDMNAVVKVLKSIYGADTKVYALGHSWGGMVVSKYVTTQDFQHNLQGWINVNGAVNFIQEEKDLVELFQKVAKEQISEGRKVGEWTEVLNYVKGIDTSNISEDDGLQLNRYGHKAEEWLYEGGIWGGPDTVSAKNKFADFSYLVSVNHLQVFSSVIISNLRLGKDARKLYVDKDLWKVEIPSLFIGGKYDLIVPPTSAQNAYDKVSSQKKELFIFETSGHNTISDDAALFVRTVVDFVERTD